MDPLLVAFWIVGLLIILAVIRAIWQMEASPADLAQPLEVAGPVRMVARHLDSAEVPDSDDVTAAAQRRAAAEVRLQRLLGTADNAQFEAALHEYLRSLDREGSLRQALPRLSFDARHASGPDVRQGQGGATKNANGRLWRQTERRRRDPAQTSMSGSPGATGATARRSRRVEGTVAGNTAEQTPSTSGTVSEPVSLLADSPPADRPTALAKSPPMPATASKRLEFARWLVSTGRLSDW